MFFSLYLTRNILISLKRKLDTTRQYCKPACYPHLCMEPAYNIAFFSGLLNLVTRPLGGYIGDVIYRFYGTKGKKAWIIFCGFVMGATILAGGLYLQSSQRSGDANRTFLSRCWEVLKKNWWCFFFGSPDSHGCILAYFNFLRAGERCLFCSRTSFSPQRTFVRLILGCWTWHN